MSNQNSNKRKLKSEPKFGIQLDSVQKEVVRKFYEKDITLILGEAGTGKTLLACYMALSAFRKKEIDRIIISRPIVSNGVGILPGDIKDKMEPWVAPIVHNLEMCQGAELTRKMLESGEIKILPVELTKGITYVKSTVIIDEAQDLNYSDFRLVLTRLGKDSKLVFCASETQVDPSKMKTTCLPQIKMLEKSGIVSYTTLKNNHRHGIITEVLEYLEKNETIKDNR